MRLLADSTKGPDTPKWVNIISPSSENTVFPFVSLGAEHSAGKAHGRFRPILLGLQRHQGRLARDQGMS